MQKLFSEFKKISAAEWKERLVKDLKGEAYESLIWKNENGFEIQPFYTAEDLGQAYTPAFSHADWHIGVRSEEKDARAVNAALLRQLAAGAGSVSLCVGDLDLEVALKNVQLDIVPSVFFTDADRIPALITYLTAHYDLSALSCSILPTALKEAAQLQEWTTRCAGLANYPQLRTASADLLWAHNQNGHAAYEVGMICALLVEQLAHRSASPGSYQAAYVVRTGVNADYFVQIAKLRALRRLWQLLRGTYGASNSLYVLAESSLTNKSVSDNYNNLLRTTLEAMAAVAGGCNELVLTSFDVLFATDRKLSERMAINQQLILKEESYLNRMADVGCGSYYIESLTDALATKALEWLKHFEQNGGYFECLRQGVFARDLAAQAAEAEAAVLSGQRTVIGVNKYKNPGEHLQLSDALRAQLQQLPIHNPTLQYELKHIFKTHA